MTATTAPSTSPSGHPNPIANVRTYWRLSGLALAGVAILGIVLNAVYNSPWLLDPAFLSFDWAHNVVHVVLAAIALTLGFATISVAIQANFAKVIGIVYLALGVVGFVSGDLFGLEEAIGLHLELGENLFHIVIGAWGAYAGFAN